MARPALSGCHTLRYVIFRARLLKLIPPLSPSFHPHYKFYNFLFRCGFAVRKMEPDKVKAVNQCIQEAARQTASVDGLMVPIIDRFLRAGEETWEGAGSGRFTHGQIKQDEAYTRAAKTALQTLFRLLSNLLPAGAQLVPQVAPEILR